MNQAAKQYREPISFGLLGVAFVYLVSGLALLFKGYDRVSIGFSDRAALDGHVFSHPVLILSLIAAVALVAFWGEASAHARTIVLAALALGAVSLVFAVITWIAAFSSDGLGVVPAFAGVYGAGKIVGAFLTLAQIGLLLVALFFAGMALQALPRPVRAPQQWGPPYQQAGWAPNQEWQQSQPQSPSQGGQWGGQQQYQQPPAAPWASPPGQQGWGGPSWQPPQQQQPGWTQAGQTPDQGWQQPQGQSQEPSQQGPYGNWPSEPEQTTWQEPSVPSETTAEPSHAGPSLAATREPEPPASPAHVAEPVLPEPVLPEPSDTAAAVGGAPDGEQSGLSTSTTASEWGSQPVASASEVAASDAAPAADEQPADEGESAPEDPTHDQSGWWRPSSS